MNHIKLRKYPTQTPSSWSVYLLPWSLRATVAIKLAGNLAASLLQTPCTTRLACSAQVLLQVLEAWICTLTNLSVLVCTCLQAVSCTCKRLHVFELEFQFWRCVYNWCATTHIHVVEREISISSVYTWSQVCAPWCCGRSRIWARLWDRWRWLLYTFFLWAHWKHVDRGWGWGMSEKGGLYTIQCIVAKADIAQLFCCLLHCVVCSSFTFSVLLELPSQDTCRTKGGVASCHSSNSSNKF